MYRSYRNVDNAEHPRLGDRPDHTGQDALRLARRDRGSHRGWPVRRLALPRLWAICDVPGLYPLIYTCPTRRYNPGCTGAIPDGDEQPAYQSIEAGELWLARRKSKVITA